MAANRIRVISNLGCSPGIADGAAVARIEALDADAKQIVDPIFLRAGTDTAEWAIDRPDIASTIRHRRPTSSRAPVGGPAYGLEFETTRELGHDHRPVQVHALRVTLESPSPGAIAFSAIILEDSGTGRTQRVDANIISLTDEGAWSEIRPLANGQIFAKYNNSLGLAWLVDTVVSVSSEAALEVVRGGRLPSGEAFDPASVAVVESAAAVTFSSGTSKSRGSARVLSLDNDRWILESKTPHAAFLVVSQSYDQGWQATVNGQQTPLLATNYLVQGLPVPAGTSRIELRYRPTSVLVGGWVSGTAAAFLMLAIGMGLFRRHRRAVVARPREAEDVESRVECSGGSRRRFRESGLRANLTSA
jgi:hypothetical protein